MTACKPEKLYKWKLYKWTHEMRWGNAIGKRQTFREKQLYLKRSSSHGRRLGETWGTSPPPFCCQKFFLEQGAQFMLSWGKKTQIFFSKLLLKKVFLAGVTLQNR